MESLPVSKEIGNDSRCRKFNEEDSFDEIRRLVMLNLYDEKKHTRIRIRDYRTGYKKIVKEKLDACIEWYDNRTGDIRYAVMFIAGMKKSFCGFKPNPDSSASWGV